MDQLLAWWYGYAEPWVVIGIFILVLAIFFALGTTQRQVSQVYREVRRVARYRE